LTLPSKTVSVEATVPVAVTKSVSSNKNSKNKKEKKVAFDPVERTVSISKKMSKVEVLPTIPEKEDSKPSLASASALPEVVSSVKSEPKAAKEVVSNVKIAIASRQNKKSNFLSKVDDFVKQLFMSIVMFILFPFQFVATKCASAFFGLDTTTNHCLEFLDETQVAQVARPGKGRRGKAGRR
jgi:uncharacterized membrane protein YheB (UPF0754 family)